MDGQLTGADGKPADRRAVTSQVFLELLARDAAAVEFERPLIEARSRGAGAAVLAELDRSKVLAMQVRATLERRRRREAELTALFESSGDLVALRDLDTLLQAIVRRARQLLNTDLAYLTLTDEERGDTVMRVTEGSVSAHFQRLRLPTGAGLGGLVAQTGRPYTTPNYLDDPQFRHLNDIDTAVSAEGIVSILGVPLRLGARVIGVLFAANRSERPFVREEIALLSSLAAHATVAIDTARLLTESATALEQLNLANELVRAHSGAVERAADAHDRMADLVLRGGGVDDVAAVVADVIGGALLVVDGDGRSLARVGDVTELDPANLARAVAAARSTRRAVRMYARWVAAVGAGSEHLGALVLDGPDNLDDAAQRILERAAQVTALLLLLRRSVADAEHRVRGELIDDLLRAPDRDPDGLRERARRLGADLDAGTAVVVAHAATAHRQRLAVLASRLAAERRGLAGEHAGQVVLLLPEVAPGQAAQLVARSLGGQLGQPVTAGAAGPATGPVQTAGAHAEALRCLDTLRELGRDGDGASADDLGFIGLVLGDRRDVAAFVQRTIGSVLSYDTRRGTELVRTVETYFGCGGNLVRASRELHVHVNTVTQRLERVGSLIGDGWQQPERALEIQLALRLHRLRNARPGS